MINCTICNEKKANVVKVVYIPFRDKFLPPSLSAVYDVPNLDDYRIYGYCTCCSKRFEKIPDSYEELVASRKESMNEQSKNLTEE